jgi:iron(III) transport system ATP-binding protein
MNVAENVAFGLEERRVPRALARALVIRPRCLLLDEPLSNLDAKLRLEMRTEIRRVCKEFNLTTVYVTHDQKEALSISDRMAILEQGHILQVGTPREVYRRPMCKMVANFIGETDFIAGRVTRVEGGHVFVDTAIGRFEGLPGDPTRLPAAGAAVTVSVRPECWKLGNELRDVNCVAGRIGEAVYLGEVAQYGFVPVKDGDALKIYELNPRFMGRSSEKMLHATADVEDVVILLD